MELMTILYSAAAGQGVFLALLLLFSPKAQAKAHVTLAILVMIFTAGMFMAIFRYQGIAAPNLSMALKLISIAIGPLFFIYCKQVTQLEIASKEFFHLSWLLVPVLFYLVFDSSPVVDYWPNLIRFILQTIVILSYLAASFWLIHTYQSKLKDNVSNTDKYTKRWLSICLAALTAILSVDLSISIYQWITMDPTPVQGHQHIVILESLLIFTIGAYSYRFPSVVAPNESETSQKYQNNAIVEIEAVDIERQLLDAFKKDKLHLDNELTLAHLSQSLQIPSAKISQTLNVYMKKNFYDFVNEWRVKEVKNELLHKSDKTITQLAYDAGFNNKTSFHNAFKKHTGLTPSQYKKAQV